MVQLPCHKVLNLREGLKRRGKLEDDRNKRCVLCKGVNAQNLFEELSVSAISFRKLEEDYAHPQTGHLMFVLIFQGYTVMSVFEALSNGYGLSYTWHKPAAVVAITVSSLTTCRTLVKAFGASSPAFFKMFSLMLKLPISA